MNEVTTRREFLQQKARDPGPDGGLTSEEVNEYFNLLDELGLMTNPDMINYNPANVKIVGK